MSGKGTYDDDYAKGTYYPSNMRWRRESVNDTDQRGDIIVLQRLLMDGITMRWHNPDYVSDVPTAYPVEGP